MGSFASESKVVIILGHEKQVQCTTKDLCVCIHIQSKSLDAERLALPIYQVLEWNTHKVQFKLSNAKM
jgi:hypothetical protein